MNKCFEYSFAADPWASRIASVLKFVNTTIYQINVYVKCTMLGLC